MAVQCRYCGAFTGRGKKFIRERKKNIKREQGKSNVI